MLCVVSFLLAIVLVVIDQFTKQLAITHLMFQEPIPIIENVFSLQFRINTGIAMSMLEGERWLILPITCVVMALLAVMLLRSDLRHSKMFSISCAMILGGGVGNLIDRLTYKYVVDFLYFELIDFPIFNFADCCVVVGAILLFVYILFICKESDISSLRGVVFGSKRNKKEQHDDNRDEDLDGSDGCK